jgi:hypothetical protein
MRPLAAPITALSVLATACPGPSDVQLAPPPAGQGFQLATAAWEVPKGTEQQRCYFFRVPGSGTAPLWVSRIVAAQNPGSHHLNVFRVKTIVNLDGEDGDLVDGGECWKSGNWADWPLVINSQESVAGKNVVDWTLPSGVAHKFVPGEKLMLQTHYVNANTQSTPGRAKALVNFDFVEQQDPPLMELGTVFATNQNIRICPGDTNKSFTTTCRFARGTNVTIAAANGHFHSRGVKFTMTAVDQDNNTVGGDFYTSTQWADPVWTPDLSVQIGANGGIGYTCTFTMPANGCGDPANGCCATFGGHVETQEHCNAFVYYYPKVDDATCF